MIQDNFIFKFLRTKIISNNFIHLDYWSFVHFASGMIIMKMFNSFFMVLLFISIFEIVENNYLEKYVSKETLQDTIWDIIIGMAGAMVYTSFIS